MDLGVGLRDRGHEIVFFSPRLGASAQELKALGFQVTDCLSEIGTPPDLIHGQHTVPALRAACAFPEAPLVYICHDALSPADAPTPAFLTDQYAAVDHLTARRIEEEVGVSRADVEIFGNVVDTTQFTCRVHFAESPRRALIYSGSTRSVSHFEAIRSACAKIGLPLDEAGERANGFFDHPEKLLPNYDIVFCKARCAMEAMATGAYVILIGDNGMGPAINRSNVADLRLKNFGREALACDCTESYILSRIRAFDSEEAKEMAEWTHAYLSQKGWLDQVEATYKALITVRAKRDLLRELPLGARLKYKDWRLRLDTKSQRLECAQLSGAAKFIDRVSFQCGKLFRKHKK